MPSHKDPESSTNTTEMPRTITLLRAISLIMGSIIGTGIFMSPKTIVSEVGSIGWALIIWIFTGLFALFGGIAYLELGLMMKKSGAEYTYLQYTFGSWIGYILAFVNMLVLRPISACIMAFTFSEYVISIFTGGSGLGEQSHFMNICFALLLLWGVSLINMYSTTISLKAQTLFLYSKLMLAAFIIFAGMKAIFVDGKIDNFTNGNGGIWAGSTITSSSIAKAVFAGLWPYDAWNNLNFMIEEIQNPEKNMKNAILISLPGVIVIYLLINVSYFTFLTTFEIKESAAIAVFFGEKAFYDWINVLTPFLVAISALGAFNGMVLSTSRFAMVAGRDGNLPSWYSLISFDYKTPISSLFIQCFLSSIYLLPKNASFHTLLDVFAFAQLFVYGLTFSSLIILRSREPNNDRPFKIYLPIAYFLAIFSFFNVFIPLFLSPRWEYVWVIIMVFVAFCFYKILIVNEKKFITDFNVRFENYLCERFNLVRAYKERNEDSVRMGGGNKGNYMRMD